MSSLIADEKLTDANQRIYVTRNIHGVCQLTERVNDRMNDHRTGYTRGRQGFGALPEAYRPQDLIQGGAPAAVQPILTFGSSLALATQPNTSTPNRPQSAPQLANLNMPWSGQTGQSGGQMDTPNVSPVRRSPTPPPGHKVD